MTRWMLQWRARRLPPMLAERLLEEWLAEVEALAPPRRLAFALGVLFTRTSALVRADGGEDGRPEGAVISFDEVLVPVTEQPTLAAAYIVDLLWIAPLALLILWAFDLPRPYHLFELVIIAAVVGILVGVQIARYGGSAGMLVMKLRIVTMDGGPLRVGHLVVRAVWMLAFPMAASLSAMLGLPKPVFIGCFASLAVRTAGSLMGRDPHSGTMIVYVVPRVVAPPDQ